MFSPSVNVPFYSSNFVATLPTFNLFPPKDNKDKDGGTAAGEKKDSISGRMF